MMRRSNDARHGSGTVCGLVVITPASGFVDQTAAFVMGAVSAPVVYFGLKLKVRTRSTLLDE